MFINIHVFVSLDINTNIDKTTNRKLKFRIVVRVCEYKNHEYVSISTHMIVQIFIYTDIYTYINE